MSNGPLSMKQNIIWNSIGSVIYLGCQWLMSILIVRLSNGYENAGIFSLAMSIGNLFTPFAIYRMRAYQVSDTYKRYSSSQYAAFRIATIAIAFIGCELYTYFTCNENAWPAITLYLLYKGIECFIDVLHGIDQRHLRMDIIGKSFIIRGLLTICSFSMALHFSKNLEIALISIILVTAPVLFFYDYPSAKQFDKVRPAISRSDTIRLLTKCLPAVAASIACSAVLTIPRQYLAVTQGDAALGIYASIASPVALVQMGGSYVYSPLLGSLADTYNRNGRQSFTRLFFKSIIGVLGACLVCCIGILLCGEKMFALLYGPSIVNHLYLLPPMLACAILTAILWFLNDLLLGIRDYYGSFFGNASAIIVALLSAFLLIDTFGMNGISYTGIIAYTIGIAASLVSLIIDLKHSDRKTPKKECHE